MDFLFPPACAGCDRFSYRFCPSCYQDIIAPPTKNCCKKCGDFLVEDSCPHCSSNHFMFESIVSLGIYRTSLRQAILQLKFHRNLGLGDEFAPHLKQLLHLTGWDIDQVIPVPVSAQRRKERGFNQAEILAYPLALSTNLPYSSKALLKTKEAHSQIGLSFSERMQNIQEAFKASSIVQNKNILLVDDVITTGATLNSCTQALLIAGAKKVYGLSLARTVIKNEITLIL